MPQITVSFNEALAAVVAALKAAGASPEHAAASARALVTAEAEGNRGVGLKHVFTYGEALREGRIRGDAEPKIEAVADSLTSIAAAEGLPHLGVDRACARLVQGAAAQGLAIHAARSTARRVGEKGVRSYH